jgi:hypothetical protein
VKVDALTLMGEHLKTAPKNNGSQGRGPGRGKKGGNKSEPPFSNAPTLADLGINKRESSDAQALADLKDVDPKLGKRHCEEGSAVFNNVR